MANIIIKEINGVEIFTDLQDATDKELVAYVKLARKTSEYPVTKIEVMEMEQGNVSLEFSCRPPKFDRIRRITGYLVGTVDKWNDGKKAELNDRVKHNLSGFSR